MAIKQELLIVVDQLSSSRPILIEKTISVGKHNSLEMFAHLHNRFLLRLLDDALCCDFRYLMHKTQRNSVC